MSEPTSQQNARPRLRPGQPVIFRAHDPYEGRDLTGHGIVLRVSDDGSATVAPLSLLHLQVSTDSLTPVKPEDVPTTAPQPAAPPAESAG